MQRQHVFFDPSLDRSYPNFPSPPTEDELNVRWARNNCALPLNQVIISTTNEGNFSRLHLMGKASHRRFNHSCRGFNWLVTAPPGQGKTFLVKLWAQSIGIPFVFIQSGGLVDTQDLFVQICKSCEKFGTPVVPDNRDSKADYILPPCIVFFDEAHRIKAEMQEATLLNPMEPSDARMHIREGKGKGEVRVVDCKDVCWIAATTDPAELFDAFRSRFLTRVEWAPAGMDELPAIIEAGLIEKVRQKELPFAPPLAACKLIAHYQKVPRLAIHAFGMMVVLRKEDDRAASWSDVCRLVATNMQMDQWGMTQKQTAILTVLGQRPIAKGSLGNICQCRTETVLDEELPGLQQYTNGGPFCASLTGRGLCITESGLRELDKRGIRHNGRKVTVEHFESKR